MSVLVAPAIWNKNTLSRKQGTQATIGAACAIEWIVHGCRQERQASKNKARSQEKRNAEQ